jgi:hypothetical protein
MQVQIALYQGVAADLSRVSFVQTISFFTENTGVYNWTVPVSHTLSPNAFNPLHAYINPLLYRPPFPSRTST